MTIYIFISEGEVDEVLGTEDFEIIDYDDLNAGKCPICQTELMAPLKCPNCGMDYEGAHTNREVMERHRKYWGKGS